MLIPLCFTVTLLCCLIVALKTPGQNSAFTEFDINRLLRELMRQKDDDGEPLPPQKSALCTSFDALSECSIMKGDRALMKKSFLLSKAWLDSLEIGSEVDSLDFTGRWYAASVAGVRKENMLKIHFLGKSTRYDE